MLLILASQIVFSSILGMPFTFNGTNAEASLEIIHANFPTYVGSIVAFSGPGYNANVSEVTGQPGVLQVNEVKFKPLVIEKKIQPFMIKQAQTENTAQYTIDNVITTDNSLWALASKVFKKELTNADKKTVHFRIATIGPGTRSEKYILEKSFPVSWELSDIRINQNLEVTEKYSFVYENLERQTT